MMNNTINKKHNICTFVLSLLSMVFMVVGCDEPNNPDNGGGGTTDTPPAAPVIITHPSSQTVLVGSTVTLSVAVTEVTGVTFTYQWQTAAKGSSTFTGIEGATNSSYTTAKLGTNDNGVQYRVVVTATADKLSSNVTSSVATITVSSTPPPAAPVITTHPFSKKVLVGSTVTLSVAVTAVTGVTFTYQWQTAPKGSSNFTGIEGATNSSYTTAKLGTNDNGVQYRVVVTATNAAKLTNTATSSVAIITVSSTPPPIVVGTKIVWTDIKDKKQYTEAPADGILLSSTLTTNKIDIKSVDTIPSKITSIGNSAFYDCTSLTSIVIPNSVKSIGDGTFGSCKALISITLPNSITSISNDMFIACSNIKSVTIPSGVTKIGDQAFQNCTSLSNVNIPSNVISIGHRAFSRCTSLANITIPTSVTSIGGGAFNSCTGLTSVTIPSSVTDIEGSVFYSCTSLTSITIPNSVTSIGINAFTSCTSLKSVTIPSSVKSIETNAFSYCSALTSVRVEAKTPPTAGVGIFYEGNKSLNIMVPSGSLSAYKNAEVWKWYTITEYQQ